jgi:hypothetical protein
MPPLAARPDSRGRRLRLHSALRNPATCLSGSESRWNTRTALAQRLSTFRTNFFANLQRLFTEREIVELTAHIAHENYNAKSARPLRVEANNFCEIPFPQPKTHVS